MPWPGWLRGFVRARGRRPRPAGRGSSVSRTAGGEDFVTAILAQFDDDATMRLLNFGHPPPALLRGGRVELLEPCDFSPPLGLPVDASPQSTVLAAGDRVVFYTDGLVEARDKHGRFFPLLDRLQTAFRNRGLEEGLDRLLGALLRHTAGPGPDTTSP